PQANAYNAELPKEEKKRLLLPFNEHTSPFKFYYKILNRPPTSHIRPFTATHDIQNPHSLTPTLQTRNLPPCPLERGTCTGICETPAEHELVFSLRKIFQMGIR